MRGCSRRWHSHREVLSRVSSCSILPQWDDVIKKNQAGPCTPSVPYPSSYFPHPCTWYLHTPKSPRTRLNLCQLRTVFWPCLWCASPNIWSPAAACTVLQQNSYSTLNAPSLRPVVMLSQWSLDQSGRLQITLPESLAHLVGADCVL